MRRCVGSDLPQAPTAICFDDEGRTLAGRTTATDPGAIAAFVRRRLPGAVRIGRETGPPAVWRWNEFRALGLLVVRMDVRHATAGMKLMQVETHHDDATDIDQPVRAGLWRQIHVGAAASHAVHAKLAARTLLLRIRCAHENQLRGMLKRSGLVIDKAPSRLVERAHEILAEALAVRVDIVDQIAVLMPDSVHEPERWRCIVAS